MNEQPSTFRRVAVLSIICCTSMIMTPCAIANNNTNTISVPSPTGFDEEEMIYKAAHVTPSPQQLALFGMEFYAFVHFNLPTFLGPAGTEIGTGQDDPKLFNPTDFDARQWERVCRDAGMKMLVLVPKHH